MNTGQEDEILNNEAHSLIESISLWLQSDIDKNEVQRLVSAEMENPGDVLPNRIDTQNQSSEVVAALTVAVSKETKKENFEIGAARVDTLLNVINNGKEMLDIHNDYWRFEPCIEAIFEMNPNQLEIINSYLRSFFLSDYSIALEHKRQSYHRLLSDWDSTCVSPENIQTAIGIYEDMLTIFERGFPNLLAMKRVLDGKNPNNDNLQNKRPSSVRRELTDTEAHLNSAYFDLIVGEFDNGLRNGVCHGDLVNDPIKKVIRIPTQNNEYSYTEINEIVEANISNAVFLTGMFQSLVEWQHVAHDLNEVNRELLSI